MSDYTFIKGEKPNLGFVVRNVEDETIVITEAIFCLTNDQGEIALSGNCIIEEDSVFVLLPLNEVGEFTLEITVTVPPEIIKERIDIRVVA